MLQRRRGRKMTWDGIKSEEKKMWAAKQENPKSRGLYTLSEAAKGRFDDIDFSKKSDNETKSK